MNQFPAKNLFLLFLTAFIWGTAFVAQSVGMDHIGPFTFNAVRSLVGGLALIPVILVFQPPQEPGAPPDRAGNRKVLLLGGVCCGLALGVASCLQQVGMQYTTVGKAGFLTALYIVIVPILGLFFRRKAGAKLWVSVAIAIVGLYLLCMSGSLRLQLGDFLVLLCALAFSVHIMVIDHFTTQVDGVQMSCISSSWPRPSPRCACSLPKGSRTPAPWPSPGCPSSTPASCPRRGVYPADRGAEGGQPHRRQLGAQPGVRHLRAGRLGDPGQSMSPQRDPGAAC